MASITNKTHRPLSISLPGGKTLRLGPLKRGEIADRAVDHPAVRKLVEAGEVEVITSEHAQMGGPGENARIKPSAGGQGRGGIRRTGDR